MTGNRDLGRAGEQRAADWYEKHQYTILDRNWRIRTGELDIVAARPDVVVFCEVKTRTSTRFGSGAEAVDWKKQRRIRQLARHWLRQSNHHFAEVRFDVADVDREGNIEVYEGCF